MRLRPRLALAILGFTVPFLMNCVLVGGTALMMMHDENPLFIVASITMSLCVTLVLIKATMHLITELAGPLETGPARRITARDVIKETEEIVPMRDWAPSPESPVQSRPMSPVPPPTPSPPSPSPSSHLARSDERCELYSNV